ncbi:MAG: Na+/proline symporter, partial [Leptolyngbyaceae bacterium]|nr:Na+/proline symporter [Leptolyngbyaceae bacterium]
MTIGAMALLVTVMTIAAFTLFGLWKIGQTATNLEDYMVNRNQVGGSLALATVVASAMGAWILFSPPEAGSAFGGITAILGYCMGSAIAVLLFVFVGPRLRTIMPTGHSLNEYVRHRFGGAMYWLTAASMVFYMFVYLSAELTAIAKVLELMANIPLLVTALAVMIAVFAYTTYGGLRATILTDGLQFVLILPLLLICFIATVMALGGFSAAFSPLVSDRPDLLSLTNVGGLRFGLTLIIAIVAAELFNQGNWQRVYACRTNTVVRRSFLGSALVILPMVFIAGLLGLVAVQFGFEGDTAFFGVLQSLNPPGWLIISVLVLAIALVMSSLDSLLNGITSVFTIDLLRLMPDQANVLRLSRLLTVVVGIPAVAIAAQGYSVLYLFFIADLICAALLFPLIFSLYNRRQSAKNALWSSITGIAAGVLFFPKADFTPLFPIPGAADLLHSFGAALLVSTVMTLVWNGLASRTSKHSENGFDYRVLETVRAYSSDTHQHEV